MSSIQLYFDINIELTFSKIEEHYKHTNMIKIKVELQ